MNESFILFISPKAHVAGDVLLRRINMMWPEVFDHRGVSMVLVAVLVVILLAGLACTWFLFVQSSAGNGLPGQPSFLTASTPTQELGCSNVIPYDESAPPAYQGMYTSLGQILDNFNQTLSGIQPVASHGVIYATELLPADSNIGDRLLSPQAMQGVINYLNAIQKLGIDGVTIDISYPVLVPTFPNYNQYLNFYESVVQQVRSRGMKIDVESETPLLVGYPGLPLGSVSYANLTYSTYVSEDRAMIQTVIADLHPDYLNIGTETDTLQALLHYPEISTPQGWGAYINSLLTGLNKGSTKIDVGIGSWDPISYLYATLNDSAVDAIDVHVYPVYGSYLSILTRIGERSEEYNKPIVIDEMWLHKSIMNEGHNFATDAEISARNLYAFWIPLDEEFFQLMSKYAQDFNVAYVSPFEGTYLFAYLNYTYNSANIPFYEARQVAGRAAGYSIANGLISPLGCYYQDLIDNLTTHSTSLASFQTAIRPASKLCESITDFI